MSRLKKQPGESLQQWIDRVTIKKPRYRLDDTDVLAIGLVVFCLVCIGIIEMVS